MNSSPSPSDVLRHHAPEHVSDRDLDALLGRVQATASGKRHPGNGIRRFAMGGAVAAATIAATVLLPAALKAPDGAASGLDLLATTAASQSATVIPSGSYLHLVTVESREEQEPDAPDIYPATRHSWTAADGAFWRHDLLANGDQDWFSGVAPDIPPPLPGTSPAELAELPTDTQELLDHLRPIVQGSSSTDEAVFVYLGDALRTGAAPVQTQRAMISVMARLPHIQADRTHSSDGRPCRRVSYSEPVRVGMTQSVCFDEATAALIEEEITLDGEVTFRSTITARDVVDEVPADVVAQAGDPMCDDQCESTSKAQTDPPPAP